MIKQVAHFERHTGEHDHDTCRGRDPEARRGAPPIGEHGGTTRHHRLGAVALARLPTNPLPTREQVCPDRLIEFQGQAKQFAHHDLRDIVACRTEAAGGQHQSGAGKRRTHRLGDIGWVIAHRRATHHAHADAREALAGVGRVGINSVAEEQFMADGHQLERGARAGGSAHVVDERKSRRYWIRYITNE